MAKDEFVLDAESDNPVDIADEDVATKLKPTTDITHSILEPMKIEPLKLPQKIIDQMKASYEEVCLNDFKDMYHMSEEEKKQSFQFYEVFRDLRMVKTKHRKLDTFVEAYRSMMKALNAVADVNGVYSKEEFVKKVLKGKIKVYGLKKPKYSGSGKKDINWDVVAEYIMDTEKDPTELAKPKNESFFTIATDEDIEKMSSYVGKDLVEYMDELDQDVTETTLEEIDLDEEESAGRNIVEPFTKKEQKMLFKNNRELLIGLKDARKLSNSSQRIYSAFAFELAQDSFDEIRERDELTGRIKVPEFKGNALKQKDVDKYLAILEDYERAHTQVELNGRYYSADEADEISLKQLLEQNGYDIRKFYTYKEDEKKMLRQRKKEKQKIEKLKKTLRNAKKRYEERDSNGKVNSKKKKKSKKQKKSEKSFNNHVNGGYDNFEEYSKYMESWGDD